MSQLAVFNEFILAKTAVMSNITITTDTSNIFISTIEPGVILTPTNIALVATSIGPVLGIKGLVAGTNIFITSTDSNVIISSTTANLVSLGAATLMGTSAGPNLTIRGLVAGSNISITSSDTTLTIANSRPLLYAKFVASNPFMSVQIPTVITELPVVMKVVSSDSIFGITNSPVDYRIYNNSGDVRTFRIDLDVVIGGSATLRTVGLIAQGETTTGNNYYFTSGQTTGTNANKSIHIARNITLINGQYVSIWGSGPTVLSATWRPGTSITMNTID